MQDPSSLLVFPQLKQPEFPEQEQLKCPRCNSNNTKFCYYNNYNLSQPRHYCKNCKRYWTKGGSLRNIPIGGGTRKITKRTSSKQRSSTDPGPGLNLAKPKGSGVMGISMASEGQFGNMILEGMSLNGLKTGQDNRSDLDPGLELVHENNGSTSEGLILGGGDQSLWNGTNNGYLHTRF
ncbi:unnamed protein product [Amaranthus hypochondriacus]